jgi:hypothetical protein
MPRESPIERLAKLLPKDGGIPYIEDFDRFFIASLMSTKLGSRTALADPIAEVRLPKRCYMNIKEFFQLTGRTTFGGRTLEEFGVGTSSIKVISYEGIQLLTRATAAKTETFITRMRLWNARLKPPIRGPMPAGLAQLGDTPVPRRKSPAKSLKPTYASDAASTASESDGEASTTERAPIGALDAVSVERAPMAAISVERAPIGALDAVSIERAPMAAISVEHAPVVAVEAPVATSIDPNTQIRLFEAEAKRDDARLARLKAEAKLRGISIE